MPVCGNKTAEQALGAVALGVSDVADLMYRTPGTRRSTRARCWGWAGEELPRCLLQKPGDNRNAARAREKALTGEIYT